MLEFDKIHGLSRRDLFRFGASLAPALPLIAMAGQGWAQPQPTKAAAADTKPSPAVCHQVPDTDPVAKAIKYAPDGSKVADRPAKMGVDGKNQACGGCQLYTKQSEANGLELGKCTMLTSGCVNSKGWCTAWVKRV